MHRRSSFFGRNNCVKKRKRRPQEMSGRRFCRRGRGSASLLNLDLHRMRECDEKSEEKATDEPPREPELRPEGGRPLERCEVGDRIRGMDPRRIVAEPVETSDDGCPNEPEQLAEEQPEANEAAPEPPPPYDLHRVWVVRCGAVSSWCGHDSLRSSGFFRPFRICSNVLKYHTLVSVSIRLSS